MSLSGLGLGSEFRSRLVVGFLLIAAATATACGRGSGGDAVADTDADEDRLTDAIAVRVTAATREPISAIYSTSGTLRADKRATVTSRTRGVVKRLLVEEGDRVAADQPLAVLEDDEQRIEADRTRATLDTERNELERSRALYGQDLLSEEDFETARREFEDAKHAAELAELSLSRTVIRAPFAGRVLERHLDAGAPVSDGTQVFDLADLDPLHVDVSVPERHVIRLAAGQTVRLLADASGETVDARIERIAPSVDPSTGTVKVTLAVPGSDSLRPGAFVRVEIVTETHPEALIVPRSSLVAEGRRWHLFRLADSGDRVEQLQVELGFEQDDRIEVTGVLHDARPLERGDLVVDVGASALTDGAKVEVMNDARGTEEGA